MDKCKNTKERIIEYIYGEMDIAGKAGFEAHLKECPDCGKLVLSYAKVRDAYAKAEVRLSDSAWQAQLVGIKLKLAENKPTLIEKMKAFLSVKKLSFAMAIMLMVAGAGTGIYTSEKLRTQDRTIAEKMEMLENLDIIERFDFYKQVSDDDSDYIDESNSSVMPAILKGRSC